MLFSKTPTKEFTPPPFLVFIVLVAAVIGSFQIYDNSREDAHRGQSIQIATTTVTDSTSSPQEEIYDWKTYRNEEYGFELTFPDNWEGYKVFDFKDVDGNSLIFCLPTSDKTYPDITCDGYNEYSGHASVFSIGIETESQRNQWNQEFLPPILGKKDGIVFSWSKAQDNPNDLLNQYTSVDQILSTFKFISTSTPN